MYLYPHLPLHSPPDQIQLNLVNFKVMFEWNWTSSCCLFGDFLIKLYFSSNWNKKPSSWHTGYGRFQSSPDSSFHSSTSASTPDCLRKQLKWRLSIKWLFVIVIHGNEMWMREIEKRRKNSRILTMIVMMMIPWQINFSQGENIISEWNSRPCQAIVTEMEGHFRER